MTSLRAMECSALVKVIRSLAASILSERNVSASHWALLQSLATAHEPPSEHRAHTGPPQSTPVSCPFCTPSVQLTQTDLEQIPLVQSASAAHAAPKAHVAPMPTQMGPPQSTLDSVASLMKFEHTSDAVSTRHTDVALSHFPVRQSVA